MTAQGQKSTGQLEQQFIQETGDYLESKEIFDLFDHLLKELVVNQPVKPLEFLINALKKRPPLLVCVVGPPGINRKALCQELAKKYNIRHIHVGSLLKEKVPEARAEIEACNLVRDDVVIETVRRQIEQFKAEGFVLDGFPRTKGQAQALQQCGVTADKLLLLNGSENRIRQQFAMKVAGVGAAKEEAINMRLQHYYRHILGIAEMFKNVVRQIDATSGDEKKIVKSMVKCIGERPYSNAPLRPPRVCLLGALGSGRTTQARLLAKDYGLVHVDVEVLVRELQEETARLDGVPPEYVPDEDLCEKVARRLKDTDCMRKGWVLDGFPKTESQAEFLRRAHLWPTRLVHLIVDEQVVVKRLSYRKTDPVTGFSYYGNPPTVAIRQRLVQGEYDKAPQVLDRYAKHANSVGAVMQTFAWVSSVIKGDMPITNVQEQIQEFVDRPLPKELAQDDGSAGENY